jgi:putative phage-type endonuclease
MITFLYELEDLKDQLDTLVFEDEPDLFTDEVITEILETALHLMNEFVTDYPNIISEPNFYEIILEEITELFYIQLQDLFDTLNIHDIDDIEEDINELLEYALNIFIILFYPERSTETNEPNEPNETKNLPEIPIQNINILKQKIQNLRELPQPVQRTPEWYQFRSNLITASNAWKAFESQSAINQLIYEKCQPIKPIEQNEDIKVIQSVNTNTPMHHGQKYEPLSVMLYESMYKTKIEDFGCIQHPLYKFLGASPDGINVDIKSERYGRMLEIKNPVSRDITGIPKKEYWIQMQLQMEVCDLDECDFFETKFVEYSDRLSYEIDLPLNPNYKGCIIQFYTKEGIPFYVYRPFDLRTQEDIDQWEEEKITFFESEPYNYSFTKYIYWKLEQISCVLVLRNREWFKNNIGQLEKVWKIVEEERVTGFQHRAPNKRNSHVGKIEPNIPFKKEESNLFTFLSIKKLQNPV